MLSYVLRSSDKQKLSFLALETYSGTIGMHYPANGGCDHFCILQIDGQSNWPIKGSMKEVKVTSIFTSWLGLGYQLQITWNIVYIAVDACPIRIKALQHGERMQTYGKKNHLMRDHLYIRNITYIYINSTNSEWRDILAQRFCISL